MLKGNYGRDKLDGGAGNDKLFGGVNADTFIFKQKAGHDVIRDFVAKGAAHDFVDLKSYKEITSFADLSAHHMKESHGDVVITIEGKAEIVIEDVKLHDLTKADFIL
jgi:Ca2+-binding RTX toxin-like protein